MNIRSFLSVSALSLSACIASAQGLKTEISVSHEVIPEERTATRLRLTPALNLPDTKPGRLMASSSFSSVSVTPFFNQLEPADYLVDVDRYPWRGYASLAYGPVYNLNASAGYRFVEKQNLTLDGYMQFNGMNYNSHYTKFQHIYADKVNIHRNSILLGANTSWKPAETNGELKASVFYNFSAYNFPILDIPTALVNNTDINANLIKVDAVWSAKSGSVDYSIAGEYNMIAFAKNMANNGGKLRGSFLWHYGLKSAWGVDIGSSLVNSTIVGHKGIIQVKPKYVYSESKFSASVGLNLDFKTGNCKASKNFVVAPDVKLFWEPLNYLGVWANIYGRMDDNNRSVLYNEQSYLLPQFDAGFSRIYVADAGVNFGPWHGASIGVFGGYAVGKDWYLPAIVTGEMAPVNIQGAHGGLTLSYDYRRLVSFNVKAEIAQSPDGDFSCGYAFWRDHARFNLTAQLKVRPITPLEVSVSYHLRTNRSKVLVVGELNLLNINNLSAAASYAINSQWSAFVNVENILNQKWYLGPSMPSQGIVAMAGVTYKF